MSFRHPFRRSRRAVSCGHGPSGPVSGVFERLEQRTLLNATLTSAIAPVTGDPGGSTSVNLDAHFNDPTIVGTAIEIQTPLGNIPLTLFDSQTPQTVANFQHYISSGEYNNLIIHRSVPGFVVQGGGYTTSGTHITTFGNVPGEPGISNTTGTIAMALSSGPNSGTSEWFINLTNNDGSNGTNLNNDSDGGPFTAFGKVIYNGMAVVNAIAALPVQNLGSTTPFTNLPVLNANNGTAASNLVVTNTVDVPALTYHATSDNPSAVNPVISGNSLALNFGSAGGAANVTVTATDLGGNTAVSTFAVAVGNLAQATIGRGIATSLRFTDPDGTAATVTLAGEGSANITLDGAGLTKSTSRAGVVTITGTPQSVEITTTGTNSGSTLSITSRGGGNGQVDVNSITADASLRGIVGPQTAVSGPISVAGTLNTLTLAQATGSSITVSGTGGTLTLNIATVSGESINSSEATIVAGRSWGASAPATISAPSITRVAVTGEFDASVSAGTMGTTTAGSISGGTWTLSGSAANVTAGSITGLSLTAAAVGRVTSRGAIDNSLVNSASNIAAVSAAGMSGSKVEAGSPPLDASGIPTGFPNPGTLTALTIGRGGFSNSVIGAPSLGRVNLSSVTSTNGGIPFGVAAHQIVALLAVVDGKKLSLKNISTADQVAAAIAAAGITPNDLVIRIV